MGLVTNMVPKILTSWGDDGSVGDNNDWLLVFVLEVINDLGADLLEGTKGSVWDSHEEVLSGGAIGLDVWHGSNTVDENDVEMGSLTFVLWLELTKGLGNLLLEVGWLLTGFLDYFISSIEHV